MSMLSVVPDAVASAAKDLQSIGSTLNAANAAAASPTTGLAAMAADEVSAAVQSVFAGCGQLYQSVSAQAAEFHSRLVSLLNGSGAAYLSTEFANAQQALGGLRPAATIGGGTGTGGGGTGTGNTPSIIDLELANGPVKVSFTVSPTSSPQYDYVSLTGDASFGGLGNIPFAIGGGVPAAWVSVGTGGWSGLYDGLQNLLLSLGL